MRMEEFSLRMQSTKPLKYRTEDVRSPLMSGILKVALRIYITVMPYSPYIIHSYKNCTHKEGSNKSEMRIRVLGEDEQNCFFKCSVTDI